MDEINQDDSNEKKVSVDMVMLLNDAANVFKETSVELLQGFLYIEETLKKAAQQAVDMATILSDIRNMLNENGDDNAQ